MKETPSSKLSPADGEHRGQAGRGFTAVAAGASGLGGLAGGPEGLRAGGAFGKQGR